MALDHNIAVSQLTIAGNSFAPGSHDYSASFNAGYGDISPAAQE
jgi:hypothetical protein